MATEGEAGAGRIVSFKAPANLARAIDAASSQDGCSMSDVARRALIHDLRQRGLLSQLEPA